MNERLEELHPIIDKIELRLDRKPETMTTDDLELIYEYNILSTLIHGRAFCNIKYLPRVLDAEDVRLCMGVAAVRVARLED